MLAILLWIMAGFFTLGAVFTIGQVGKYREPTTPAVAAVSTVISASIIVVIISAAITLGG